MAVPAAALKATTTSGGARQATSRTKPTRAMPKSFAEAPVEESRLLTDAASGHGAALRLRHDLAMPQPQQRRQDQSGDQVQQYPQRRHTVAGDRDQA